MFLLGGSEASGRVAEAGRLLPHLEGETGLTGLENDGSGGVKLRRDEHWVLNLHQSAELGVEVLEKVVAFGGLLDGGVASADTYVVRDAHIRLLSPADPDQVFVLGVDDVEHFLCAVADGLEYDVVTVRPLDLHDVHYLVVVRDLEGKHLLAQLTVHLLELYYHLATVHLHGTLRVQPLLQTTQVDRVYGACALTRRYQRVEIFLQILFLPPAYSACSPRGSR